MKKMKMLQIVYFTVIVIFVAVPAVHADSWIGYFTSDHLTGGYGKAGPFGEVVLTQDGLDVDFKVTLYDAAAKFIRTGAGDGMNFKFNGIDVVLSDIKSPLDASNNPILTAAQDLDFDSDPSQGFCGDGGGCYEFGVFFTGQGTGGGKGKLGPIEFTVLNATINQLIISEPTNKNGLGQIFVADVISGVVAPNDPDGKPNTGLIDVSSPPQKVPEPTTLLLLGLGLVGVAGIGRRLKK